MLPKYIRAVYFVDYDFILMTFKKLGNQPLFFGTVST
jgi:hypothetical protein